MGVEGQAMKNGGSHSGLGPSLLLLRAGITQVSRFPFSPSIQGIVSVATADMHPRASHGVASGHCASNGTCGDRRSRLDTIFSALDLTVSEVRRAVGTLPCWGATRVPMFQYRFSRLPLSPPRSCPRSQDSGRRCHRSIAPA